MKGIAILVALTIGLALTVIGWMPSGAAWSTAAKAALTPAVLPQSQPPGPIRLIPGLQSLTFWERTGGPAPIATTFAVSSPQLEARLTNLDLASRDFTGAATELYDAFYSDADGTANRNGAYVTIEAVWYFALPTGGGLNIAEVQLNYDGRAPQYANTVTSFLGLGDNFVPASVPNAVDGNLQTHTTMGNTVGQSQRLRITVGFPSEPPPCPSAEPCLLVADSRVTEGDSGPVTAMFQVRLSRPSTAPVTITASTQDFTAAAPLDYTARSVLLTFNSGETLMTIAISVSGDTLYEADEQFYLNLSNPVNATIGKGQGICTILDNDPRTLTICSTDTPKQNGEGDPGLSTITVNTDAAFDDVAVSLFLNKNDDFTSNFYVRLRMPFASPYLVSTVYRPPLGNQLGTTCSPFPDCVFGADSPQKSVHIDPPPYAGSYFTVGLNDPDLKRRNVRGTWRLEFDDPGPGTSTTLHCWCLKFELAQEGCRLDPATAAVPIFSSHTVRALLTSNGAPVADQPVSFTVRGAQGELRLQEEVTSNALGEAQLSYYDYSPELTIIEARAIVNGVLSIGKAQVSWLANPYCPVVESTAGVPEAETTLTTARSFRDNVLTQSPRGQRYTRLYYEFSTEAVQIMLFNPMLMLRSREIIERYKPVLQPMVNGKAVTLTEGDLDEIAGFLNAFAAKGGPELQEAINGVCRELRDPQMHSDFSITVTDGPKRELPAHEQFQAIKQIGGLSLFCGLCGLVIFAATGKRRKALRRHAAPMLVVLLGVAVVANSSAQWPVVSGQTETSCQWPPVSGQSNNADSTSSVSTQKAQPRIAERHLRQPIAFESNQGQIDSQVKFVSRGQGYTTYLTPTEAVMRLRNQKSGVRSQHQTLSQLTTDHWPLTINPATDHRPPTTDTLRMKLIGANPEPKIEGLDGLSAVSNYFIGNDSARWRANVPAYAKVKYEDVYPGVDMFYYGNQQKLEYDFAVAPGSDPGTIGVAFEGAERIEVDASGDLVLSMSDHEVRQPKPLVYQEVNGLRRIIEARYTLQIAEDQHPIAALRTQQSARSAAVVGFEIAEYDRSEPLIIDSVLDYSTYLGASGNDEGNAITVDSVGNAYVIGFTDSLDFPTARAAQPARGGGLQDAFVAKLDPTGTQLLYSTYIGGNGQDNGSAIAVDSAGNAYVTGFTGSTNFPVINAMQPAKSGNFNAFVAKLNPAGGLVYSTHLGGSVGDYGSSIAVDSSGNIYVAGVATSPNFPMVNAVQPAFGGAADVYVTKLNATGSQLVYSTYLGGSGNDGATSLAVDSSGNVYLTGVTTSPNFRTSNPLRANHGGGLFDAFVAKLNPTGVQLVYATYLGGSGEDRGFRIAVDAAGNAYVTGDTDSINFPTTNALQRNKGGGVDAFVAKVDPSGAALTYSTYLGGGSIDGGTAIAVNSAGNAYVTGFTGSSNFPTVGPLQQTLGGSSFDGFVAKLNPSGAALDFSTYLGGSGIDSGFGVAVDSAGNAYVMGVTDSTNFPTASPFQHAFAGGTADVFVAKIGSAPAISSAVVIGKKLLVIGAGFDDGAKVFLNGERQKTANDDQNPTTTLVAKKAGQKIESGQTVTLQVRNSDGTPSNEFSFKRPAQ